MSARPPFPEIIDNSLRSAFVSCPRKCQLEYIEHWKTRDPSVHLHAGAAYAAGMEAARRAYYGEGRPVKEAIGLGLQALMKAYGEFECPPESAKSCNRLMGAMEYHFHAFPLDGDYARPRVFAGERMGVEFSFIEPLDIMHPETGNPLLYAGRLDAVMEFAGGVYGLDDKTTSGIGPKWSRQWDLRSQFTGYIWGLRQAGLVTDGFMVRGLAILKSKFEHAEAITYRPPWMVDRWYNQLLRDIKRMLTCWEEGYWDYNLDESCNAYGGCDFKQVCLAEEPERWLKVGFRRRRWDPVTRTETELFDE
jgi:hypothetical protein